MKRGILEGCVLKGGLLGGKIRKKGAPLSAKLVFNTVYSLANQDLWSTFTNRGQIFVQLIKGVFSKESAPSNYS